MTQVTRKDEREGLESMIRRFNRKVQQSGSIAIARRKQYFEKDISKKQRRESALVKEARRKDKIRRTYLGK